MWWLLIGALFGISLLAGLFATLVVKRARQIRARDQRVVADALEPRSTFPTITVAPSRHVQSVLGTEGYRLAWREFPESAEGLLGVTDREVVLVTKRYEDIFHVPLARVYEASLIGQFGALQSTPHATLLRLTWNRGGERISSIFVVEGNRAAAERVRREIHLRAALGARPAMPVMP